MMAIPVTPVMHEKGEQQSCQWRPRGFLVSVRAPAIEGIRLEGLFDGKAEADILAEDSHSQRLEHGRRRDSVGLLRGHHFDRGSAIRRVHGGKLVTGEAAGSADEPARFDKSEAVSPAPGSIVVLRELGRIAFFFA